MNSIFNTLCLSLDNEVKQLIQRNIETMTRAIKFLSERKNKNLERAYELGWTFEKIEILVTIISFYQIAIGPVRSSSSLFLASPWDNTDILYGSRMRLDSKVANLNHEMASTFETIASSVGIDFWLLQATNADDLIYKIANQKDYEDDPF